MNERALLVQVLAGRPDRRLAEESLFELERLSNTAGVEVAGSITQRRSRPTPAYLIGEGKIPEIVMACARTGASLVIFDNDLSPTQVNNLDIAIGTKVIDRTELILQIFARHARSAEAQAQVELAQLQYLISRIPVSEEQQRFQGGIGMRGPGESPFQLRNEPMRRRIRDLKEEIERIRRRRQRTRRRRPWPVVALAGYTNAGKSTLLNAMASARAFVDDRLFATLDTKSRLVRLPNGLEALLTDTVGFIRNLPHGLIASFRSTLEEIAEATLLLLVVDASHEYALDQLRVVQDSLREIGTGNTPSLVVLNKTDRQAAGKTLQELLAAVPGGLPISALRGEGIHKLKQAIEVKLTEGARISMAREETPPPE